MQQRGKKSDAALKLLPPVTRLNRADPPTELTDAQVAVWNAVVNSKPADWFPPETLPLLSAYCRACVEADRVSTLIDTFNTSCLQSEDESDLKRYATLIQLQDRLSQQMARLGTKMRLTQQSLYRADKAPGKPGSGKARPWQYEGN